MPKNFQIFQISELYWEGIIGKIIVCEFEYFKDDTGRFWINKIGTYGDYQFNGFGTKMICEALNVYKVIYISNAEKWEVKKNGLKDDYRYTNDDNLWFFIKKSVDKGILKNEWIRNPYS